ncbi:D-arabinono-1,4-lactone oxidase [Coemansia biformis]|uniref:D-arabinono-1,4-lactone oxidase n=1 Tax=Coemansia biformis TaxID=1286918 RepID=A0A9W7YAX4_9FUNG|nr:D-arabinono-1,4-lactone oxidase [Coemansia biformis]
MLEQQQQQQQELAIGERALFDRLRSGPPGFRFRNWAGTFQSQPRWYLAPETEQDIVGIIHAARRTKLGVKAVGSGHSPSDIACTDSVMLNMDKMRRVLAHDAEACTLTVEAGIRLHDLHRELERRGMALSSVGRISDQSIGGAIATATHGTGIAFGDLSSAITGLVLVDGTGARRECSAQSNPDLFDAARCSLGALGIVTRVTVQCEPAFMLRAVQTPTTLDAVLDDLDGVVRSAEHVRIWWFPHTNSAVVWRASRTPADTPKQSPESLVRDRLYGFHIYQLQLYKARCAPDDIPRLAQEHFARRFDRRLEWVDDGYRVFNFDCLFPQYVNEWAVPLELAAPVLRQLRSWVDAQQQEKHGARVHFPVEVRFVRECSVWLSPAYKRTICHVGIIMYRPYHAPVPYKRYWRAFEDIMRAHQGRPHWAKAHTMTYRDLVDAYPRLSDFSGLREACDPDGIFVNDYIRRHITPPDPARGRPKL